MLISELHLLLRYPVFPQCRLSGPIHRIRHHELRQRRFYVPWSVSGREDGTPQSASHGCHWHVHMPIYRCHHRYSGRHNRSGCPADGYRVRVHLHIFLCLLMGSRRLGRYWRALSAQGPSKVSLHDHGNQLASVSVFDILCGKRPLTTFTGTSPLRMQLPTWSTKAQDTPTCSPKSSLSGEASASCASRKSWQPFRPSRHLTDDLSSFVWLMIYETKGLSLEQVRHFTLWLSSVQDIAYRQRNVLLTLPK